MPKIYLINRCPWNIRFEVTNEDEILVKSRILSSSNDSPFNKFKIPIDRIIDDDEIWVDIVSDGRETTFYLTAKYEENIFEIRNDGVYLNGSFYKRHFF